MHVLELARWPVGGIRTYFRYVYGDERYRTHHLTFVAPDSNVLSMLKEHLSPDSFRFVATKDSGISIFVTTARLLAGGNYSLVHSHGFTAGAIAAPLCKFYGIPHLMTAHDVFQEGQFAGVRGRLIKTILGRLFRMVDVIHTVTDDGRENLLEYLPHIDRNRIQTILHGIDVSAFLGGDARDFRGSVKGLKEDDYLIGFFGRFMAQKGFRYLVDAMDILINQRTLPHRPMVLTFGDGGFSREDYLIIEQRGLSKYFIKMPYTHDMPSAINGVDVVAMPSLWEACGLLAMEVLVAGKPLIGTNCIGLREVLADSPSTVIAPADARALADAIEYEMTNRRHGEFERWVPKAAKRFALEGSVRGMLELYTQVAKKVHEPGN